MRRLAIVPAVLLIAVLAGACGEPSPAVRIATTTSIDNAGLLQVLMERFEADSGIRVEPFVVGSGRAFAMARKGDVALLITHEPDGEAALRRDGIALRQRRFLSNPFLLVGPPANPAGVRPEDPIREAMRKIHAAGARFASRGDESGTHVRELALWRAAGVVPEMSAGYERLGQGMSALLRSASELEAYALTDEATFERLRARVRLIPLVTRGAELDNVYVVTLVRDQERGSSAAAFYDWLGSERGAAAVSAYRAAGGKGFAWLPADP